MSDQDATRAPAREKPVLVMRLIDGNAFAVMGAVMNALRQAGYDRSYVDQYYAEATAGDYSNLLRVSARYVDFE